MKRALKPKKAFFGKTQPKYPTLNKYVNWNNHPAIKKGAGLCIVALSAGLSACDVPTEGETRSSLGSGTKENSELTVNNQQTSSNNNNKPSQLNNEYSQMALPATGSRVVGNDFWGTLTYKLSLFVYDNDTADFIKANGEKLLSISDAEMTQYDVSEFNEAEMVVNAEGNVLAAFKNEIEANGLSGSTLKAVSLKVLGVENGEELSGGVKAPDLYDAALPMSGERYLAWDDYYEGSISYKLDLVVAGEELLSIINNDPEKFMQVADTELLKFSVEDYYDENKIAEAQSNIFNAFNTEIMKLSLSDDGWLDSLTLEVVSVNPYEELEGDVASSEPIDMTGGIDRQVFYPGYSYVKYTLSVNVYYPAYEYVESNIDKFLSLADAELLKFTPEAFYDQQNIQNAQANILNAFKAEVLSNGNDEWQVETAQLAITDVYVDEALGGIVGP